MAFAWQNSFRFIHLVYSLSNTQRRSSLVGFHLRFTSIIGSISSFRSIEVVFEILYYLSSILVVFDILVVY